MNRLRLALAVAALVSTAACSATRSIARPTSLASFAAATQLESGPIDLVVGSPATKVTVPGGDAWPDDEPRGTLRLVRVTHAGLAVAQPGEPHLLQPNDIRGYDTSNHGVGAMEGLVLGLVAGFTVGAAAGVIAGDDPPCDQNQSFGCLSHETAGDKAAIGGILGGITGALSGLFIGAFIGHTDHYVFY
jgi:hypothetical protein